MGAGGMEGKIGQHGEEPTMVISQQLVAVVKPCHIQGIQLDQNPCTVRGAAAVTVAGARGASLADRLVCLIVSISVVYV